MSGYEIGAKFYLQILVEPDDGYFDFSYCFDNFSCLCRFCCKITTGNEDVRHIFDDSTEELLNESNEFIDKIHYTLYDNVS